MINNTLINWDNMQFGLINWPRFFQIALTSFGQFWKNLGQFMPKLHIVPVNKCIINHYCSRFFDFSVFSIYNPIASRSAVVNSSQFQSAEISLSCLPSKQNIEAFGWRKLIPWNDLQWFSSICIESRGATNCAIWIEIWILLTILQCFNFMIIS